MDAIFQFSIRRKLVSSSVPASVLNTSHKPQFHCWRLSCHARNCFVALIGFYSGKMMKTRYSSKVYLYFIHKFDPLLYEYHTKTLEGSFNMKPIKGRASNPMIRQFRVELLAVCSWAICSQRMCSLIRAWWWCWWCSREKYDVKSEYMWLKNCWVNVTREESEFYLYGKD